MRPDEDSTICPVCKADWRAEPIPQEYIDKGYYRPGATHYSRLIGIYCRDRDRTVAWMCPDCETQWPR